MSEQKKTNPLIGFLIFIGFLLIAFGIPALFMIFGVGDSTFLTNLIIILIFLVVNFGLYKYRKSIKFTEKNYFDLSVKNDNSVKEEVVKSEIKEKKVVEENIVSFCTKCGEKLKSDAKFCANCGFAIKGGN